MNLGATKDATTMATTYPQRLEDGATARLKPPRKTKRTLTAGNCFRTAANVVASGPVLVAALVKPNISAAVREKVMLGVTSVTDCRYCQWGHTHWAMAHGVPLEEINQILGQQLESLQAKNPAEAAAILFAQHYAEHLDQFDPEAIANLRLHYSDAQVAEILAYVRAITLGSLTGNTVDAFLDHVRSHGRMCTFVEGVVAAAAAPVVRLLAQLAKFHRRVSMDKTRSPGTDLAGMVREVSEEQRTKVPRQRFPWRLRFDSTRVPGGCPGVPSTRGIVRFANHINRGRGMK